MQLKPGDMIRLKAYGGKVIERRVVTVRYPKVYVCTEEIYRMAQMTGKRPLCVGFNMCDIVDEEAE